MDALTLAFTAELWVYRGKAAWHFITLPAEEAQRVRFFFGTRRRGWGAVRVDVTIGKTRWKTSIFPDSQSGSYLLPIKAEIRKAEGLAEGGRVAVTLVAAL